MTQRLGDQVADAHARIERGVGILEDHLDVAPDRLHRLAAEAADVAGRRCATSPDNGTRFRSALPVVDLPQPLSPTSDSVSPRLQRRGSDALDRVDALRPAAAAARP